MSNKQAKRIKTTYDHFSYKHIDYVREIHSTDTNIFRTVKRTIPTTLTWTSNPGYPIHWHPWVKQNQNTFTCVSIRHLAWILCDSSLIRESDLAMSSSGKRRQTNTNHHQRQNKNNTHKTQTRNESTNMFMCHLCPIHVLYIHLRITKMDPSRIQPNEIPCPLSRSAFHLSFSAEHRYLKRRQRIHDG